jgi:hypothetical protein
VTGENVYMERIEDQHVWEVLKIGAGKGWKRSFGPFM